MADATCESGYSQFARKIIQLVAVSVTRSDITNEARALNIICPRPGSNTFIVDVLRHGWLSTNLWDAYYIDMEYCLANLQTLVDMHSITNYKPPEHLPMDMRESKSPPLVYYQSLYNDVEAFWKEFEERIRHRMHIVGQIARGLNYIHECNFVHRDLKPSNGM